MEFQYEKITPTTIRPIIPIYLHFKGNLYGYKALIDSGADNNIFHADIGRVLGLKIETGKLYKFGGIKSAPLVNGYVHKVELEVGKDKYLCDVVFSDHISDNGFGILGQVGFFDRYRVEFNYKKEIVRLTKS